MNDQQKLDVGAKATLLALIARGAEVGKPFHIDLGDLANTSGFLHLDQVFDALDTLASTVVEFKRGESLTGGPCVTSYSLGDDDKTLTVTLGAVAQLNSDDSVAN